MFAFLALATLAAAPSDDTALETALFDLCPKVIAGKIKLDDAEQVAAIGYAPSQQHGIATWVRRGEGETLILLASAVGKTGKRTCSVTFVDDAGHGRFDRIEASARAKGYAGLPAGALGDSKARMVRIARDGLGFTMLTTLNHIELGDTPSDVVMIMPK
ncbi:hypothetical protein [Sphingomonas sp.]|uniref:hypothetical protein n=1 Tax=Sphingomonas sp. TaxID=28214 RepID=UPI001B24FF71|nr:hypothetical protein [Sphingomonas sp.]MBO9715216.1 hypothetical protein [Sphingomonas sp.]